MLKGDRDANAETPFYTMAGVRTGGVDYPIDFNLAVGGLSQARWHHLAVTFRADLNVLNLWIDGNHISYQQIPGHSLSGNGLPLEIGRGGAATGKYSGGLSAELLA